MRHLDIVYKKNDISWFTPVELFKAYGIHLCGYVEIAGQKYLWVAKRIDAKPTFLGMLDHLVAGGRAYGIHLCGYVERAGQKYLWVAKRSDVNSTFHGMLDHLNAGGLDLITSFVETSEVELFECPVCFEPLVTKGPPRFNLPAIYRSGFKCTKCNKSYSSKNIYLDLTVTAGTTEYTKFHPSRTELFRSPLVSFLYERGWRHNFSRHGFPGPDEEFKMAQEYFKPTEGGVLVDVSCRSGLFSRKFFKSGTYSKVIALEYPKTCFDKVMISSKVMILH